jgi:hypothetical protein
MRGRRALLRAMLTEEWRLHARLFGGRRFAAFPVVVAALTAATVALVGRVGTPLAPVVAGLHALVAFVGVQTGAVGLVSRDTLEVLVGDATLLVANADTLPVGRRDVVATFLASDLLYYGCLFLGPVAVGLFPAVLDGRLPAGAVFRLWASASATFVAGAALTLAAVAVQARGRAGRAVGVAALAAAVALVAAVATGTLDVDLVAVTPYALYARPLTPGGIVAAVGPTLALVTVGVSGADPAYEPPARTIEGPGFDVWRVRLRDDRGLVTKTLLGVARSDGGILKVGVSAAVVLAVAVGLVGFAGRLTGRPPVAGVAIGALVGLTAFTTHNWLTAGDDLAELRAHPVDVAAVLRAKARGFGLLGPPVAALAYAAGLAWTGTTLPAAVAGVAVLAGVQSYLYGVTVHVGGLHPDRFLFDPVRFGVFTAAVAAILVPVLVAAFALPATPAVLVGVGLFAAVAGVVGLLLVRRAPERWTRRHR